MSRHTACKKYGVPVSTIRLRMSGKWKNQITRGPRSVLTDSEEKKNIQWLTIMQERGFPVSQATLKFKVNEFIVQDPRKTPFKDGQPGRKWFKSFMRRNPGFSLRTPESITTASARVSEGNIRGWFSMTKDWIEKNDVSEILLDASRVWNGDETSFYLHPKTREVIARKGSRNVYEVEQAAGKQNFTVMFSFSAAGAVVTPQVILPGQRVRKEVAEGFPPDWLIWKMYSSQ
ncbi:uncharacterized protein LOC135713030 [Ochlerotatus camptorhynchus]|uniref:uncharacterized protein LOC135713030 n=1 Tax=Ochlerotatus camptorhynchus TaxID=644619 RepID=UPI0031DE6C93